MFMDLVCLMKLLKPMWQGAFEVLVEDLVSPEPLCSELLLISKTLRLPGSMLRTT